jgi:hypothetical protein
VGSLNLQAVQNWADEQAVQGWADEQAVQGWADEQAVQDWADEQAVQDWADEQAVQDWADEQAAATGSTWDMQKGALGLLHSEYESQGTRHQQHEQQQSLEDLNPARGVCNRWPCLLMPKSATAARPLASSRTFCREYAKWEDSGLELISSYIARVYLTLKPNPYMDVINGFELYLTA